MPLDALFHQVLLIKNLHFDFTGKGYNWNGIKIGYPEKTAACRKRTELNIVSVLIIYQKNQTKTKPPNQLKDNATYIVFSAASQNFCSVSSRTK